LLFGVGNQANTSRISTDYLMDFAIGAAASEQIVIPDLYLGASVNVTVMGPKVFGPFDIPIPSGSRLAARCQCVSGGASFDLIVYGVN
jgi:hypothetical protein